VHALARHSPNRDHYILYFHSKSMTRFLGRDREATEIRLHNTVVAQWKRVLSLFQSQPHIDKIGSSKSWAGWIWFNYWWVRASYADQVEPPLITPNRYYYETWVSLVPIVPQQTPSPSELPVTNEHYHLSSVNCHGLSIDKVCDPPEACHYIVV
jgi:hypothetical protein